MNAPSRLFARLGAPLAVVAAAAIALHGCADPAPLEEARLLVIDGVEIRLAETKPYVDYLRSYRPDGGTKSMVVRALEDVVLPMRLAQREFPEQRRKLHEEALGLSSVAGNVAELEQQSQHMGPRVQRSMLTRNSVLLAVAPFLFDEATTNAVSPPIETPQGWYVVGAFSFEKNRLAVGDRVDALQVGFVTHFRQEWDDWYRQQRERIADKLTFVHPDYRDCLPDWIQPVREQ